MIKLKEKSPTILFFKIFVISINTTSIFHFGGRDESFMGTSTLFASPTTDFITYAFRIGVLKSFGLGDICGYNVKLVQE